LSYIKIYPELSKSILLKFILSIVIDLVIPLIYIGSAYKTVTLLNVKFYIIRLSIFVKVNKFPEVKLKSFIIISFIVKFEEPFIENSDREAKLAI
jgi:type VI protein secretion system component Hcp